MLFVRILNNCVREIFAIVLLANQKACINNIINVLGIELGRTCKSF